LEFTLENCTHFPHLFKWQELAKELLVDKRVRRQGLTWELRSGDLGETLFKQDLPLADIIFHDPYSTSKNPNLWSYRIFRRLKELAKLQSILITYSQATPVRAALLASGFFVGSGAGTGMKRESTLASPYRTLIANPLHENNWMQKWERSGKQFPVDVQDEESRRQFTAALTSQIYLQFESMELP
jgi:queuine tRNA-ribosyltransferase